jgi:hypothetical protein
MASNIYGSGRKNVGSYQVAGSPYVTASTVASGEQLGLSFPNITNNITVKLDSAASSGTKATGSVTAAYPTASASPTYTTAGTLESDHHGDTFTLDGTTFTVNYEGTGSFGVNEIKTYEQTGSALFFANTANSGSTYLTTGSYGTARSFTPNDGNPWSVSFWLNKRTGGDPFASVFKFGSDEVINGGTQNLTFTTHVAVNGTDLYIYQPNILAAGAANVNWTGEVPNEQFHHFVITCDGVSNRATYTLYRNGTQVSSKQMPANVSDMCNFNQDLYIGDAETDPAVATRELNGYMQTFGIWDKELSTAEANELYNSGSAKVAQNSSMAANLVDWWRFDSSSSGFQSAGDTEGTSYNSNQGTTLAGAADFAANVTVVQGVPIERHTQSEFYNAVTSSFNTTSNFGTFNVATPNANSSVISITASATGTGGNNKIPTFSANETFTARVNTAGGAAGGGGGSLRVHFRSTGSLPNVANNRHYWELSSASEKIEMNVKTKEIYLSADGGDCDFSLQADLTNIPASSMYQHTGSGVDE